MFFRLFPVVCIGLIDIGSAAYDGCKEQLRELWPHFSKTTCLLLKSMHVISNDLWMAMNAALKEMLHLCYSWDRWRHARKDKQYIDSKNAISVRVLADLKHCTIKKSHHYVPCTIRTAGCWLIRTPFWWLNTSHLMDVPLFAGVAIAESWEETTLKPQVVTGMKVFWLLASLPSINHSK